MDHPGDLDVLILCGGRGTRSYPDTIVLPKPLLPVGDRPIVEHVIAVYETHGCRNFVLATGYRAELFDQRYPSAAGSDIRPVNTGLDTDTGRRIALAAAHCRGDRFFATYGDGVGDVDLAALLSYHCRVGAQVTVTTVPLPSPYGTLVTDDDDRIVDFREKPRLYDHWINAGFLVVEKACLGDWTGDNLERDVLPELARGGGLFAFRHRGFWRSMDTYKDRQELDALAAKGRPPWLPLPPEAPAGDAPAVTRAAEATDPAGAAAFDDPGRA